MQPGPEVPPVLAFHTRAGCSLCEKAWPLAVALAERHGLVLERVDITRDPALLRRDGERIPVLMLGDALLGWGRLSERAIERELQRALAGR